MALSIGLVFLCGCGNAAEVLRAENETLRAETATLSGESKQLREQLDADNSAGEASEHSAANGETPIDQWYAEMSALYGSGHTAGWLAFNYGNAWNAELEHFIARCDSDTYRAYYEAVLQEAEAIQALKVENELESWGTGSSFRISQAVAAVYRNGLYQIHPSYSDFIFDANHATTEFLNGLSETPSPSVGRKKICGN